MILYIKSDPLVVFHNKKVVYQAFMLEKSQKTKKNVFYWNDKNVALCTAEYPMRIEKLSFGQEFGEFGKSFEAFIQ